ncbi:MAG: hypothetical protein ACK5L6_03175 [Anaerorhabdus sp.]|uniref:hypothetical protein n=1 Tax=Anaerorhabdus sp. TaxID=1872524 RepID=UPI003A84DA0F
MYGASKEIIVVYYDKDIESKNVEDILNRNLIIQLPLIYMNEPKGYEGQLTNSIIKYNGNFEEAKQYVVEIFNKYGYGESYNLRSISEKYLAYLDFFNRNHKKVIVDFLIAFLVYVLSNYFLLSIDFECNEKLYTLRKREGLLQLSPFEFLYKFSLATIFATIINIVMKRLTIDNNMIITIFLLIAIEIIIYIIFTKVLNNKAK